MAIKEARARRIKINLVSMAVMMTVVNTIINRGDGGMLSALPRAVMIGVAFSVGMMLVVELLDPVKEVTLDRSTTPMALKLALKEIHWFDDDTALLSSNLLLGDIHITRSSTSYHLIGSKYRLRKLGLL